MISEIPKTPQQQGFSGFFICSDNDLITGFSGAIILSPSGLRVDCRRIPLESADPRNRGFAAGSLITRRVTVSEAGER